MRIVIGQELEQSSPTSVSQVPASHRRRLMWLSYSWAKYRMVVATGFIALWPRPQRAVSLMWSLSSFKRAISSLFPSPSQIRSRIESAWESPSRQGVHLPHDSEVVNWRK